MHGTYSSGFLYTKVLQKTRRKVFLRIKRHKVSILSLLCNTVHNSFFLNTASYTVKPRHAGIIEPFSITFLVS